MRKPGCIFWIGNSMPEPHSPIAGLTPVSGAAAALLCFLFGANTVAVKISLNGLGVFTTAGIRFGTAAVILSLWVLLRRDSIRIDRPQLLRLLVITAIFVVQLSLFYAGIQRTYVSRGTLLANVQPFFVLFLAHFFVPGDRINRRKLLGICLAFFGVVLVFFGSPQLTEDLRKGDMIILAAAFLWACNGVYTKNLLTGLRPTQLVLYPALFATPVFLTAALLTETIPAAPLNTATAAALLYQGLVATAFGFVAWNTLLRRYGAVAMHAFIFIMPVAGVLLGNRILGEPITANLWAALVLISAGILIVNLRPRRHPVIVHPGRNV